ncbi:MAG: aromatic prenyltransferase [Promethearchaeati archaeon]
MNWEQKIKELYNKVVERIPESVRPIIKPALAEAAKEKCTERNGTEISEVDLVVALFEVTPPAFQPTMIEDLKKLGVDYDRYLAKVKGDFKCNNDLEIMVEDTLKLCKIAGINGNKPAIWKVINVYEPFFRGSSISIRTTTKPIEKRDVSVRYVELMHPHKPDAYSTAINEGLIENNGHIIHDAIKEVINKFQIMGYGIDLDARKGLSKIWPFVVPGSLDPIFDLENYPESVKNYKAYFDKHKLNIFSLFAFDFCHYTTNIYIMLKNPSANSLDVSKKLVSDLGFSLPSDKVMESCAKAAHLNYTFNWDDEKVQRLCFGVTCQKSQEVPTDLHPLINKFIEKSPFQSEIHKFIYGVTFTPDDIYYKIENDYNGTMVDFLLMGAQAGINSYK